MESREEDLRRELQKHKFVVDSAMEAIYWVRQDGSFSYVNHAACRMLGYSREELLSLTVEDIAPEYPLEVWQAHWENLCQIDSTTLETNHVTSNGEIRTVSMHIHYMEVDGEELIIWTAQDITERRKAESQAQKVQGIFDNARSFIGLLDVDGTLLEANPIALQLIGVKKDDVIGCPFWDTPWWNHSEELQAQLKEAVRKVADGETIRFEANHRNSVDEEISVDFSLSPVYSLGEVVYLLSEFQDVTETKKLQRDIEEVAETLDTAMSNANIGLWTWSPVTKTFSVNATLKKQLGYPTDSQWGHFDDWTSKLHPDDYGIAIGFLEALRSKPGETKEARFRMKTQNGEYRWIRSVGRGLTDKFGDVIKLSGVQIDIHQPTLKTEALQESEKRLRIVNRQLASATERLDMAMENGAIGIWELDIESRAAYFSSSFLRLLNYEFRAWSFDTFQDHLHEDDRERAMDAMQQYLDREIDEFDVKCRIRTAAGAYRWFECRGVASFGDDGAPKKLRGVLVDINEFVLTNQELEQFAYVASHDLRSPLRGLRNIVSFLREDDSENLSDSSQHYLEEMVHRVELMDSLLDDLLAYSRVGKNLGQVRQVDAKSLIEEISSLVDMPDGIQLQVSSEIRPLLTYLAPLRQVLLNLVGNAVKYHDKDFGNITVNATEAEDYVKFTITDDGPGIDEKYHEKIFVVFQRVGTDSSVKGSGMGLAIVKKTVQEFGGHISLQSSPNQGSTFTFTWPKVPPRLNK